MKLINIITLFFFSLIPLATFAVSLNIDGVWTNSYGSIMRLSNQHGELSGCYSSKTASSGAYPIRGFIDINSAPQSKATTLAFALPWRSYLGGKGDPSWHWASTMSGIYFIIGKQEKLELLNALYITTKFPGINTELGLFPESLTFIRYSDQHWQCPKPKISKQSEVDEVIFGNWKTHHAHLTLEKNLIPGLITGSSTIDNQNYPVVGYYDYDPQYPTPNVKDIAVALIVSNVSSQNKNQHSQLALVGELKSEQKILDLYTFKTFALKKYSANKLGHSLFIKTLPIKVTT